MHICSTLPCLTRMSVRLSRLSLANFGGKSFSIFAQENDPVFFLHEMTKVPAEIRESAACAIDVVACALNGITIPSDLPMPAAGEETTVVSEYVIRPFEEDSLHYDVRYEFVLSPQLKPAGNMIPAAYFSAERLTYIECREGKEKLSHRRKAFDTFGVNKYAGLHPRDVMSAMARSRGERARVSALRVMAQGLGRSFLFLDEFLPFAQKSAHLRPGAYFLRVLRAFAAEHFPGGGERVLAEA